MDGFNVKPEAFTFEFLPGADSGFHIKPEAFVFDLKESAFSPPEKNEFHIKPEAFAILTSAEAGFHIKPEAFAIIGSGKNDSDGFHVKPEAFTFEFLPGIDNGFHVKPEAFAFNLTIVETQLVLRVAIRHNGENIILPFTTKVSSPAVVIRWGGRNWYNPMVSPTDSRASAVLGTYKGTTFAFST